MRSVFAATFLKGSTMRVLGSFIACALATCAAWAQDSPVPRIVAGAAGSLLVSRIQHDADPTPATPKAKIRLPASGPTPVTPVTVTNLFDSEWYVIDGDVPFVVVASPTGIVTTSNDVGPVKLRGKFAGGNGANETRSFTGKQVTTVEAASKGVVELIVIPVGFANESEILRVSLNVNGPIKPPPPGPDKDEAPIAGEGFKVMIFYDANKAMTESQHSTIFGVPLRKYLDTKCATGPDGSTKEYRILDPKTDTTHLSPALKDSFKLVKENALPMIVISQRKDGKGTGFIGPLPSTADEINALIKKYGGE